MWLRRAVVPLSFSVSKARPFGGNTMKIDLKIFGKVFVLQVLFLWFFVAFKCS